MESPPPRPVPTQSSSEAVMSSLRLPPSIPLSKRFKEKILSICRFRSLLRWRRREARRQRRPWGSTDPAPGLDATESPRPLQALTDELLEEIFVRIGSPADLARASTACVAFRRLIADPTFLRRYRSLHPPLLLGLVNADCSGFQPAEAPHPSSALARTVARAADFSFKDYLPRVTRSGCHVWDVRDGRVLIECLPEDNDDEEEIFFPDLAVCDPLARRCPLLPPIPDDLAASVLVHKQYLKSFRNLLVPSGEEDDDTLFRVITRMDFTEMVVAFIFSSASGLWSAGTSVSWDALGIPHDRLICFCSSYMHGCFYWKVVDGTLNKWLRLDISSMEFSAVDLPPLEDRSNNIIVEAGEGRLGIFTLDYRGASLLYTIIRQIGDGRSDQLEMENVIPLPAGFRHCICGPYEGYIVILSYQLHGAEEACFMLEIKTLEISRVCRMRFSSVTSVYPYFGFPPSMSLRRI